MLKQHHAIDLISTILKDDRRVLAMFLKGSFGRGEADSESDVDFYCLVQPDDVDSFLATRRGVLEQYRPILFWAEANFVGPQAVVIFDDGLHFDLFTVTAETLPQTEAIKILYDPNNLLGNYTIQPLSISIDEVSLSFNNFAFSLMEVKTAIKRNNIIWGHYLISLMMMDVAKVYRYQHDPDNAQLAMRHIDKLLDEDIAQQFKTATIAPLLERAQVCIALMRNIAQPFAKNEAFNWILFDFMASQIQALED